MDDYNRYMRDNCVENSMNHLKEVYSKNEKSIKKIAKFFFYVI